MNPNIIVIILYTIMFILIGCLTFVTWKFHFREAREDKTWGVVKMIMFLGLMTVMGLRIHELYSGL